MALIEKYLSSTLKKINIRGRQPVYFLIHNHNDIYGPNSVAIQNGICSLIASIRQCPYALEDLWISIITYGGGWNSSFGAQQIIPLQNLDEFDNNKLDLIDGKGGLNTLGAAISLLCECIDKEVISNSSRGKPFNDDLPHIIIVCSDKPDDDVDFALKEINKRKIGAVIICYHGSPSSNSVFYKEALIERAKSLPKINNLSHLLIIFDGNYNQLFKYISELLLFGVDFEKLHIPIKPSELQILCI